MSSLGDQRKQDYLSSPSEAQKTGAYCHHDRRSWKKEYFSVSTFADWRPTEIPLVRPSVQRPKSCGCKTILGLGKGHFSSMKIANINEAVTIAFWDMRIENDQGLRLRRLNPSPIAHPSFSARPFLKIVETPCLESLAPVPKPVEHSWSLLRSSGSRKI